MKKEIKTAKQFLDERKLKVDNAEKIEAQWNKVADVINSADVTKNTIYFDELLYNENVRELNKLGYYVHTNNFNHTSFIQLKKEQASTDSTTNDDSVNNDDDVCIGAISMLDVLSLFDAMLCDICNSYEKKSNDKNEKKSESSKETESNKEPEASSSNEDSSNIYKKQPKSCWVDKIR